MSSCGPAWVVVAPAARDTEAALRTGAAGFTIDGDHITELVIAV